MLHIKEVS